MHACSRFGSVHGSIMFMLRADMECLFHMNKGVPWTQIAMQKQGYYNNIKLPYLEQRLLYSIQSSVPFINSVAAVYSQGFNL